MDSSLTVSIILCALLITGNWSIEEGTSIKLQCLYEKSPGEWGLVDTALPPNKAWLVLRSRPESDVGPLDFEGVKFIFKDSPVDLMLYLKEDLSDLHCEIKPYFTDNTHILWPGVSTTDNKMDSWYVVTVQHPGGKFHTTTFFTILSETTPVAEKEVDKHHVLATFMLNTHTPHVYTRLKGSVLLDCSFIVDHQTDVSVTWSSQGKGRDAKKLLSYNGSTKKLQNNKNNVLMQVEEIQKGNVSLLVNNLALEDEGVFTCTVSAASLFAEQQIRLEFRESPTVTLNVDSLTLKEGQEQKFVCDASNYYPLDVNIEWLREDQSTRLLPTLLLNVIYSSHKYNNDGTYSLSGFFLYRASLLDNGIMFTCRVEHKSLKQPIRKSVRVTVLESNLDAIMYFTTILIVIFIVILLYLGKIYFTGKKGNKPKPY